MQVDLCSGHPDRICLLTTTHKICICICICLQHAPLGAKHAQSGAVLPRELRLIARTTAATTAATAAAATAELPPPLPPPLLLPSLLLPSPLLPSPLLPSPLASLCRGRMSATSSTRQWAGTWQDRRELARRGAPRCSPGAAYRAILVGLPC